MTYQTIATVALDTMARTAAALKLHPRIFGYNRLSSATRKGHHSSRNETMLLPAERKPSLRCVWFSHVEGAGPKTRMLRYNERSLIWIVILPCLRFLMSSVCTVVEAALLIDEWYHHNDEALVRIKWSTNDLGWPK